MAKATTDLSDRQLIEGVADSKKELFNLRFQLATGQLKSNARIKEVKREAARYLTEIRAREIAAAEAVTEGSE